MHNDAPPQPGNKRWQQWCFLLAFALLLAWLFIGNVLAWSAGQLTQTARNGWQGFTKGEPMAALAEDLRTTDAANTLGRLQRQASWLLLRDLGPRVQSGCPGWLFLTDEMLAHPDRQAHAGARADLVIRLHTEFQRLDSRLVIALIPDKSRVAADQLCGIQRPAALDTRLQDWRQQLKQAGVPVLDTTPALASLQAQNGNAFWSSDTHWSPDGAKVAASAIAEGIIAMGFAPSAPVSLTPEYGPLERRWGDLVRLAGLDRLPASLRPEPDLVPDIHFTVKALQATALDADALFGSTEEQRIALLGTSFSRNAHFADFLVMALQAEVGNLSREGGGFAGAMNQFLASELVEETRWIIWEIPERALEEPPGPQETELAETLETQALR